MASTLLVVHSLTRWLVLLAGLFALARMAGGFSRQLPWTPADLRVSRIFIGLFDLQFLFGLILYGVSPLRIDAMRNMTTAMQDPHTRFIIAEHPLMMFVALCAAHGASIWARKAAADRDKFLRSAIGFALALGLILAGIPWWRMGAK